VLVVSIMPTEAGLGLWHLDKVAHVCEYLVFSWLLLRAFRSFSPPMRRDGMWAWLCASGYGALMEIAQAFIPWRDGSMMDALMNVIGAAAGVWLFRRGKRSTPA